MRSGLPDGGGNQLRDMVNAAREMQQWLAEWNELQKHAEGLPRFEARIGIHHEPSWPGVVELKSCFRHLGRYREHRRPRGTGGRRQQINISGNVYGNGEKLRCHKYRGKIAAKNKGEIDMYFVEN